MVAAVGRSFWQWRRWRSAAAAFALVVALGQPAGQATTPASAPVSLSYEVSAHGFPVLTLDFRIAETPGAYSVSGVIRTSGVIDWLAGFVLRSESRGVLALDAPRPSVHESSSHSRRGERRARLDYAADGTVKAVLSPAEDPGHPLPTAQQAAGTLDPLSAILAIHHEVARVGSCDIRVPVYDGRRRYDLVLADDGVERLASSVNAAEARRCSVAMVKIAGFSSDRDAPAHTDHGRVWILPARGGMPSLPVRIEFESNWGPITVRMTRIALAK